MRKIALLLFILLAPSGLLAQYSEGGGGIAVTLNAGVPSGSCTPRALVLNTSASPPALYFCSTSGTFQRLFSTLDTGPFITGGTKAASVTCSTAFPAGSTGKGFVYTSTVDNALHYVDCDTLLDASLSNSYLNPSVIGWKENFVSSLVNGSYTYLMLTSNTGGVSAVPVAVDSDHPIATTLATDTTNAHDGCLSDAAGAAGGRTMYSQLVGKAGWRVDMYLRVPTITTVGVGGGWQAGICGSADTSANGIFWRFSTNASDTSFQLVACKASTCTATASGLAIVAGTWYKISLYSTIAGTVVMDILPRGGSVTSTSYSGANIPLAGTLLDFAMFIHNYAAASRTMDIAQVEFQWTGLSLP